MFTKHSDVFKSERGYSSAVERPASLLKPHADRAPCRGNLEPQRGSHKGWSRHSRPSLTLRIGLFDILIHPSRVLTFRPISPSPRVKTRSRPSPAVLSNRAGRSMVRRPGRRHSRLEGERNKGVFIPGLERLCGCGCGYVACIIGWGDAARRHGPCCSSQKSYILEENLTW